MSSRFVVEVDKGWTCKPISNQGATAHGNLSLSHLMRNAAIED